MMHLLDPTFWHPALMIIGTMPLMGLSLLGLGGGGGGLGISGQSSSEAKSGGPVTVYNGTSGPLSNQTWLIIGGVALVALLIIGMLFRGRN